MNMLQSMTRSLGMKILRIVLGTFGFLIVWFAVAAGVGSVMVTILPSVGGFVGDVLNWRNLPGSILGILVGAKAFRPIVKMLTPSEKTLVVQQQR